MITRPAHLHTISDTPLPEVNIVPQVSSYSGLSQTVNDITVEITSVRITNTGVEIGFCYTTLDGGEWYPVPEQLLFTSEEGSNKVFPDEYEFAEEKLANKDDVGLNCGLVRYLIDDLKTITAPLHFSLSQIIVHPREMYSLCEDFQYRLATNSKANQFGLKRNVLRTARELFLLRWSITTNRPRWMLSTGF